MKHLRIMITLLLAMSLFLAGCSSEDRTSSVTEKETTVTEAPETEPTSKADDLGKKQEQAGPVDKPYMQQNILALCEDGRIALSNNMNKISVVPDKELSGVHFAGPTAHFKGGRISVLGTFEFSGNPVGRVSLSGITDSTHDVNVLIYLDNDNTPVASFRLDRADGADGWFGGYTHTQDVYGKIANGSHTVSLEIDVAGAKGNEEADVLLRHLEFAESSGIPVFYFKIDESQGTIADMNASPSHTAKCYGTIDIQVPEGFVSDYPGGIAESVTDLAMDYVQGRGNSTWKDPDKKPYKFKLSKKTDLFGMGKNKNWALIANRFDNSLLRNRMTYWLTDAIGMEFTPQCIPVDVVMNDEYYGSYLLAENIRVDDSRLAIDELEEDDVEEPEVTGGYLLAMNPYYDEDPRSIFVTDKGIRLLNETPDFADEEGDDDFHGNDAQRDYIRNYVQHLEDTIFGEGFADENGIGYAEYLDVDAAVDYWWIQEFSKNGDAYVTDSTRLYKKRDGKLYWGPAWDFDYVAWGNLDKPDALRTEGFSYSETPWYDHLMTDPIFIEKLMARWPAINEKITEIVKDGGLLDRYYQQISISERYDNEKHGFFSQGLGSEEDQLSIIPGDHTYEDEIAVLKTWVRDRQAWVNQHLAELPYQVAKVTFVAFDEVVEVQEIRKGKRLKGIPKAPEVEGYYFTGWLTEDGEEPSIWNSIEKDLTVTAQYLDEETTSKADHLFFRLQEVWVDVNTGSYLPVYKTTPASAIIHTVLWSSSDESIAEVSAGGDVLAKKVGTVTITGTLKSGYQADYVLHVYDGNEQQAVYGDSLEVAEKTLTIRQGESAQNPIRMYPEDKPLKLPIISTSSEDMSVAVVDTCCVVTGLQPGKTIIHVVDYNTDCETSFEVIVLPADEMLQEKDPVAKALDLLERLDATVDREEYTEASYASYAYALGYAVDHLQEDVMIPGLIDDLKQRVFTAYKRLERRVQ